jgi:hypothetical protein
LENAGGRIVDLERAGMYAEKLFALARRLEEVEIGLGLLQPRVVEIESHAFRRINDLENAVAELQRRMEPEVKYSIHDNVIPPHKETP